MEGTCSLSALFPVMASLGTLLMLRAKGSQISGVRLLLPRLISGKKNRLLLL